MNTTRAPKTTTDIYSDYHTLSKRDRFLLQFCALSNKGHYRGELTDAVNQASLGWGDIPRFTKKELSTLINKLIRKDMIREAGHATGVCIQEAIQDYAIQDAIRMGSFDHLVKEELKKPHWGYL